MVLVVPTVNIFPLLFFFRHPVEYLHFNDNILLTANVPSNKFPYTEDYDGLDNIKHRRFVLPLAMR